MLPSSCVGIHQSGLILQSAIRAGIDDLRAKPYLLNYCFGTLKLDNLTAPDYGDAEVARAKKWFLENDIKVFLTNRTNQVTFPCISLKVLSSNEAETTLGDIHYDPYEDADPDWPILAGPFSAVAYDPVTGNLTIPQQNLITGPGQVVVTKTGNAYTVNETPDTVTLVLDTGLRDDFSQMTIRGQKPAYVTSLESVEFAETYAIGCHVTGEPIYGVYLHSVLLFILLMYRQSLFEKRNFERSTISSTGEGERDEAMSTEMVWSRYLQLSGYVRCMWPKNISPRVNAVRFQPRISGAGVLAPDDPQDAPFLGDGDVDYDPVTGQIVPSS